MKCGVCTVITSSIIIYMLVTKSVPLMNTKSQKMSGKYRYFELRYFVVTQHVYTRIVNILALPYFPPYRR
jgi:hypothetical protein